MIDENVTQFLQNCKYSNKGYKMDTERWQILLKAIDRGSLRAAAEEMGFTVSGISRSVATLEKELGFALLHRAKSGVQPTAECCQLLPSVRELLFAQERLEQTAAKVRGADCGTIVIGTAYNCYYEWVTRMMAAFRTRHPGVVIKIVNGTSSELAEMLLDHRTDFCLISHRDSLPVWLPIRQDELMVLLPKNHPLADRESFPVESLKTEPFIDSYPGMETDITLIFDKLKARPDARYSTMDITATYAMVSAGLGISVNNAINHQDGYPGVVERPMNPHQMMEIGLACGENLAPAEEPKPEEPADAAETPAAKTPDFDAPNVNPVELGHVEAPRTPDGKIDFFFKTRGETRVLAKILEQMDEDKYDGVHPVLISECGNQNAAQLLHHGIEAKWPGAPVKIVPCSGLCSFYAQDQGIIITY